MMTVDGMTHTFLNLCLVFTLAGTVNCHRGDGIDPTILFTKHFQSVELHDHY